MEQSYVLNGQAHGSVAARLLATGFDINALRPFLGRDGRSYISVFNGYDDKDQPIYKAMATNATALLPIRAWIQLDTAIVRAALPRLKFVADLRAAGLTYNVPDALGTPIIQYQTLGRITPATISMDGLRRSESDRPEWDLAGLPLPMIHKDWDLSLRERRTGSRGGFDIDTVIGEEAGERCAEEIEKLALGVSDSYSYGGYTVYGATNFPGRMLATLTLPTAFGWTPSDLFDEILLMKQQSIDANHFGPWMLYFSPNFTPYLDGDYSAAKGDNTLRDRLLKVENIQGVRTLDYLPGWQVLLVQMTSSVVRMVLGFELQTVQWDEHGGMLTRFKTIVCQVSQFRGDVYGLTGIVHGVAS